MLSSEILDFDHVVKVLKYDYLGRTLDSVIPVPRDIVEYLVRAVGPEHDKEIADCYDKIHDLTERAEQAEYECELAQDLAGEIYHILKYSDYTSREKLSQISECVSSALKIGDR